MKITIRHDQNSIDPSATYTDEQFAQVRESLEREYTKAILAEYPDAEIEFEESTDTKSIVVKTSGLDDPIEIEDNIQRITETVFETGLFWIDMSKPPTHGGLRKGAGRKKGSGRGRFAIIRSVSMSRESWDKLDRQRGTQSRGKFIAALLT